MFMSSSTREFLSFVIFCLLTNFPVPFESAGAAVGVTSQPQEVSRVSVPSPGSVDAPAQSGLADHSPSRTCPAP